MPKKSRKPKSRSAEDALILDHALNAYNAAAKTLDFAEVGSVTPSRLDRLEKRLGEIGGLEAFKLALTAIPQNRFLMGKTPPRQGQAPFRLTFERLLSTDSGLGDVLASLLDAAKSGEVGPIGPNGKRWGWWRDSRETLAKLSADQWRRALDAAKPNGTWPWWLLTAPPGHPECLVHPDVVRERRLAEIYQGRISHG